MRFKLGLLFSLVIGFSGRGQQMTIPIIDNKLQELFRTSSIYCHSLQCFQEDGRYLLIEGKVTRNKEISTRYFRYDKIANILSEVDVDKEARILGYRGDSLYLFNKSTHTFTSEKRRWTGDLNNRIIKVFKSTATENSDFDIKIQCQSFILLQKNLVDLDGHVLVSISNGMKANEYHLKNSVISNSSKVFFLDNGRFLSTSYEPWPAGELVAKLYWWDCLSNKKAMKFNPGIIISDIFDVKKIKNEILILGHEFGVGYFIAKLAFNNDELEIKNIHKSHIQDSYLDLKLLDTNSFVGIETGPFPQNGILKIYKID